MRTPGEYEDFLTVIGQILDADGARQIEIVDNETVITVSWLHADAAETRRWFEDLEIEFLREGARELHETGGSLGPRATRLGRLGRELDQWGVSLSGVVEEDSGYRVSGLTNRRYTNRLYTWAELGGAPPEVAPSAPPPTEDPAPAPLVAATLVAFLASLARSSPAAPQCRTWERDGTELKARSHFHISLHDGVPRLDLAQVNCIKP